MLSAELCGNTVATQWQHLYLYQEGLGEDRDSLAAFLFTWPDGDTSKPAIKLPKAR